MHFHRFVLSIAIIHPRIGWPHGPDWAQKKERKGSCSNMDANHCWFIVKGLHCSEQRTQKRSRMKSKQAPSRKGQWLHITWANNSNSSVVCSILSVPEHRNPRVIDTWRLNRSSVAIGGSEGLNIWDWSRRKERNFVSQRGFRLLEFSLILFRPSSQWDFSTAIHSEYAKDVHIVDMMRWFVVNQQNPQK